MEIISVYSEDHTKQNVWVNRNLFNVKTGGKKGELKRGD
jgi:hypothetical protein